MSAKRNDFNHRPTIYDVAERAGTSYATVSRYLNGRSGVAASTAKRIEQAIKDVDYTPSAAARSLAQQRTHLIALIIHARSEDIITDPNIMQIIASANARVTREGWQMVTLMSENDGESRANIERLVSGGFADGYLLYTMEEDDPLLPLFERRSMHAVISGTGYHQQPPFVSVDVDNAAAMSELIRYVLTGETHSTGGDADDADTTDTTAGDATAALRRTRPAYICGPLNMPGAPERLAAFRAVTGELLPDSADSLPVHYAADWNTTSAAAAVRAWAEDGTLTTRDAIICANDTLAVGAIEELHRLGYDVPGDVAVSGFDNSSAATSITPQLTTVDQHMERRGWVMAGLVIDQIRDADKNGDRNGDRNASADDAGNTDDAGAAPSKTVMLATDLVIRESA
ncbi:LacI family DNA-binding transcriptional regulator [Bifidobacterium parmae]|uniref:Transcription regulator CelR n=1 Tax=Bifidobacterium parmae TaxID=361854 RepID=A0A2N5J3T2_9BIFI|nr:LacI family DNA-binding transcriptional regulator [Bifidobacterium parmae]PLS28847.1 transcription regulator CelR [Bifidobacterium parmae]